MITFIPKNLSSINTSSIAGAIELTAPVSQLGKQPVDQDAVYLVDEHLFTTPSFQGLLSLLEQEHYEWRFLVGGGRDAEERRRAAAWAFLPIGKHAQVSLDELLTQDRERQSVAQSKQSVVAPTLSALRAVTNDRPGARPSLQVVDPQQGEDEDESDSL